jgi:hypothetical protein
VAPLQLGGIRGKKSTPSVAWEVPMKSQWLASGRCTECIGQGLGEGELGYGMHDFNFNGRLLLTLRFNLCTLIVRRKC